ncbi:MAG: dual specificity protein phosphatase family protein [Thaumarchaeota archaeon]|nr:dual specificity protein phosphatase family protein [Nitrososphaerota archaeon]
MFSTFDHLLGAVTVRFHRKTLGKKPDISFINQNLSVGGASKIEYLAKEGIVAVVDMRAEDHDDPTEIEKFRMSYIRLSVQDRGIPDLNEAINTTAWIRNQRMQGSKIFIHCNLGRGRGPLMAVLYLISEGIKTDEAIQTVRKARPYCYFNRTQLQMIKEFSHRL